MSEIPRSMSYAMRKSVAVQADSTLRQFGSNNGTTFSPTVNEIRINVSADGFLDGTKSYLYFGISNKNTVGQSENLQLDSDALSWVDQIRVESNGAVLERIERAGVYNNLVSRWNGGLGGVQSRNAKAGGPAFAADMPLVGQTIDEGLSAQFAVKLPLGFLHSHHGRAIPQGANFDLVVRVNATAAQCFKWEANGKTLFEITNPRFYAPVYKVMDQDVMSEYSQALMERGIQWSGDTVKTYIGSVAGAGGAKVIQINDRSLSLKALVGVMRSDAIVTAYNSNSIGASTIKGITQMTYTIGGKNYPQDQIQVSATDAGRLYEEAQKALAPEGKEYSEPTVSLTNFVGDDKMGCFAVDLRHFDDEKLMMVGLNTAAQGSPNTLELQGGSTTPASEMAVFGICESVFSMDGRGQILASS